MINNLKNSHQLITMSTRDPVELLLIEKHTLNTAGDQLAVVTLNRANELNPLDWQTVNSLEKAFDYLAEDPIVRVVGVTGAGRAFSAGGDMKKYQQLQRHSTDFPQFLADIHRAFLKIAHYPKPYIAMVNGVAVAGGLELILACDLAVAAESATIGDAHLPFGQMGGGGVLTLLPRSVGPSRARELIFSGRLLSASEACDWGLVSSVIPDGGLLTAAKDFAAGVAKKSALAVRNAKQTLNAGLIDGTGVESGLRLEREVTSRYCLTSNDAQEGLEAFVAKRKPNFSGT